jgi:hypothetical protein
MDIDEIFRGIGELGRQQQKYIAAILLVTAYAAFHMIQVQGGSNFVASVWVLL